MSNEEPYMEDFTTDGVGSETADEMIDEPAGPRVQPHGARMEVSGDLARMVGCVKDTITEFNTMPDVFRTMGRFTRVGSEDDGSPVIKEWTHPSFSAWLAAMVPWERITAHGPVACAPPENAVRAVMHMSDDVQSAPVLEKVVRAPFFTRARKLALAEGYHPDSMAWYRPEPGVTIPEVPWNPDDEDMSLAKKLILEELLGDFPFASDADKCGAVALALEVFARDMIKGNVPMHLVEAPKQGTGKSKLASVCLGIALGEVASSTLEQDEPEVRKFLTSRFLEGAPAIFFDNVSHFVNSAALAHAITHEVWSDRVLGSTKTATSHVRCTWAMTANNARYSGDFPRRISLCRLDLSTADVENSVAEQPETRSGFRHPFLEEWARDNRGYLIWASLTIIQSWVSAGCKPWSGTPLGSFEEWSRIMGGILENAGITGFLENRHQLVASGGDDRDAALDFCTAWWNRHQDNPVKPADLIMVNAVHQDPLGLEGAEGRSGSTRVGSWLKAHRDCVIGDFIVKQLTSPARSWSLQKR